MKQDKPKLLIPKRKDHRDRLIDTAKVIVKQEVIGQYPSTFKDVCDKYGITRNELYRIRSKYAPYLETIVKNLRKKVKFEAEFE